MKTLGRILIILIAALVISAAAYAISQTSAAQTLTGSASELGQMEDRPALSNLTNGQSTLSNEPGGRLEGGSEGRGGLQTLGQNLLKIAAIVVAVQVMWSIGRRLKIAGASLARKGQLNPSRNG